MFNTLKSLSPLKAVFAVMASLVMAVLFLVNIKVALLMAVLLCIVPIGWMISQQLDEETVMLGVIFLYPLLPSLWGINLGGGLPVLKAQRLLMLGVFFFLISKGLLLTYIEEFIKARVFNYVIIALVSAMAISSIFSANKVSSIFATISYITEIMFLAVISFNLLKKKENLPKIINCITYSALILSCFGLFERLTHYNIYAVFGSYSGEEIEYSIRGGEIRVFASFSHSIAFGAYLVMSLPMVMYKYKNDFIKFSGSVGIIMGAILFTQSRSALGGAILVIISYFIFIGRKNLILIAFFSIPVLFINWDSLLTIADSLNPVSTSSEQMLSSTMARKEQFNFLMTFIDKNPIIGYGQVPPPMLYRLHTDASNTVDNYYLLYTYYYGLLGLITLIIMVFDVVVKSLSFVLKEERKNELAILLLTSMITFSLINIIVALYSFFFIYWIYIGIMMKMIVDKRNENETEYNNR